MATFETFESSTAKAEGITAYVQHWDERANASVLEQRSSAALPSGFPGVELFDSRTLIADSRTNGTKVLQGSVSTLSVVEAEAAKYADQQGVVPFGSLQCEASKDRAAAHGYLVLALPIQGDLGHQELIDVNVPDSMKVNGRAVLDQGEHHGVFPITHKPGHESNWNWIDATIARRGNKMYLNVHALSPSEDKPKSAEEWDRVNWSCELRYQMKPQRLNAETFWSDAQTGTTRDQSLLHASLSSIVRIKETAQSK